MPRPPTATRPRPLVGLGLALLLAALPLFGSSAAKAQSLPPGIANCRDITIRTLYEDHIEGRGLIGNVHNRLNGITGGGFFDTLVVDPWTKRLEPALYLLREQINYKGRGIAVELPEVRDVPQMLHFDRGIKQFYISYVYKWGSRWIPHEKSIGSEQTKRATESHFVHSIAYAAYEDEGTAKAKAKEYLTADMEGKTRVVLEMKRQFQNMGNGDINSKDPTDPYNRKLVASWSSFWIQQHMYFDLNGNYTDPQRRLSLSINEDIEIPLREAIGFSMRGPPEYKL